MSEVAIAMRSGQRNILDAPAPPEENTLEQLLLRSESVLMRLQGRAVALFFGLGGNANNRIPRHLATLTRLLEESTEGRRVRQAIDALPEWSQQQDIWWALSGRAARLARASGRKVHVYCDSAYLDAEFPSPTELHRLWVEYREIFRKIESLDLPQALFHALDDAGCVLASWEIDYRTHTISNFRRAPDA